MENQNQQEQLSPDALAATLAHATNAHEQSLPQAQQEQPLDPSQTAQDAPGQEMTPEAPKDELPAKTEPKDELKKEEDSEAKLELKITDKLDAIRKELKDDQKGQIDSLRREIENALNQEEKNK